MVVTAQKRPELAQDVPISITALGADALQFRQVNDLQDLQYQVPGIFYSKDVSAGQQITIRGVGLTDDSGSVELPVATYIDGVYQTRGFRGDTLGIDVDRVEVLRGPQGTLFGRNATGGAINIILAQPTDEFVSKVLVGGGNYGQANVEGVASGPIIKGLLDGRLAASFDRTDGWVENELNGKTIDGHSNYTGRLALKFQPLDSLTADFELLGNEMVGGGVAPPIVNILVGSPKLEASQTISPPTTNFPNLFINGHNPWNVKVNSPDGGNLANIQGALTVKWDLTSWASLKSITALQNHTITSHWDGDGTGTDLLVVPNRRAWTTAITQEFDLQGSQRWFNWLAGAYVIHDDFYNKFAPLYLPPFVFGEGLTTNAMGEEQLTSFSFFGDSTVNLPWNFKAFGGLRYTQDEKHTAQTSFSQIGVPGRGAPFPGGCFNLQFEDHFNNWSPRYGLLWDATENIRLYAKRSFGYNGGGHYFNTCDDGYKSETLDSTEAGLKSRWFEGRLTANVSLYLNQFHNFQVFRQVGVSSSETNAKRAKMQGAEIELVALPIEQVTLNTGISLLRSEYKGYSDTDVTNPSAGLQNLSGDQLTRAPNYTVTSGAEYSLPIPGTLETFRLHGEWFLTDYILFRPYGGTGYGGEEDRQRPYSIFNAFATLSSPGDKYQVRLFCKNLMNQEYYDYKVAYSWGARLGVGGVPRQLGIELLASF